MLKRVQREVSLVIALSLAFVGGYLDIYTYLARGKVFANTQTGNLVLLGRFLVEGNIKKIIYYSLSLLFFALGIGVAKAVEHFYLGKREFLWMHITIGIEIVILFLVMYVPTGAHNVLANVMVSFVCAVQVQSFRKVNGVSYSTTAFTGNLKNAVERLSHYLLSKDKSAVREAVLYFAVIVMFIVGAGTGTFLTKRFNEKAVGFVDIVLGLVFVLLFFEEIDKPKEG